MSSLTSKCLKGVVESHRYAPQGSLSHIGKGPRRALELAQVRASGGSLRDTEMCLRTNSPPIESADTIVTNQFRRVGLQEHLPKRSGVSILRNDSSSTLGADSNSPRAAFRPLAGAGAGASPRVNFSQVPQAGQDDRERSLTVDSHSDLSRVSSVVTHRHSIAGSHGVAPGKRPHSSCLSSLCLFLPPFSPPSLPPS